MDAYHRDRFGLAYVGTSSRIVENLDAIRQSFPHEVAVVTSLPETALAALRLHLERGTAGRTLSIIHPIDEHVILTYLAAEMEDSPVSLSNITIGDHLVALEFADPRPGDFDIEPFLAGLAYGRLHKVGQGGTSEDNASSEEVRARLLSALELIASLNASGVTEGDRTSPASVREPGTRDDGGRVVDLENRLVALRTQYDGLQRKYDALAQSALGRYTLRRWARR